MGRDSREAFSCRSHADRRDDGLPEQVERVDFFRPLDYMLFITCDGVYSIFTSR